jgi:hypothetical protein
MSFHDAFWALAHRIGGDPIESGAWGKLADNECKHGRLPGDSTEPCGCWPQEPARKRDRSMVGVYRKMSNVSRIPDLEVMVLHGYHRAGASLRELAAGRWEDWGYASPQAALNALRSSLRRLDMPARDRLDVVRSKLTTHGELVGASEDRRRGVYDKANEYRRRRRRKKRCEEDGCDAWALKGGKRCHMHTDPERARESAARMRAARNLPKTSTVGLLGNSQEDQDQTPKAA